MLVSKHTFYSIIGDGFESESEIILFLKDRYNCKTFHCVSHLLLEFNNATDEVAFKLKYPET